MIQLLGANLAAQAGSQILQGIGGIVSGIAGSRQRRQEQADAARSYTNAMARFEDIDTSNPYANITNPYANLTVNQQQADFMAQQTQQASANTMSQLRGAAGGSGVAALAQAMANQQTRNLQQASATIGAQEAANQRLMAQGAMQTQMARAQGDYLSQRMQANQATTQLSMAQRRKAAADQARQQATGALIGGIGKIAGGVMAGFTADKALKGIGMDGLFGKAANTANNVTNGVQALKDATQAATGDGLVTSNFNPQIRGTQQRIDNLNAFMKDYQPYSPQNIDQTVAAGIAQMNDIDPNFFKEEGNFMNFIPGGPASGF